MIVRYQHVEGVVERAQHALRSRVCSDGGDFDDEQDGEGRDSDDT